jgi:hypothetical protein
MAELRNAYCVSVGRPEWRRQLRRRRSGLWDNIRMDLGEI